MYDNGSYMQMQSGIHPQQMEWVMQQQRAQGMNGTMQPRAQSAASRAYHLEPINQQQHRGSAPGMMMLGPQSGAGGMNYGPPPAMMDDMQDGRMSPSPAGGPGMGAAYGMKPTGYGGGAGMGMNTNSPTGMTGVNGDWNSINFHGIFNNAANPQTQFSVASQDDGQPLPFPPGNILAQYPPDYQQQLVFYYRLLRLQYPELYQQYVTYYETYYEPLYYPAATSPEPDETHEKHKKRKQPSPQPAPRHEAPPPPQPMPQPVHQPPPQQAPPPEQPKQQNAMPRTTSNLSGGLKRQSSLRRQNSMRRNEVNQLKNEGGLKRLPSMRQQ